MHILLHPTETKFSFEIVCYYKSIGHQSHSQVSLYDNAPVTDADLAEQEVYELALAHIWEGYTKRWPQRELMSLLPTSKLIPWLLGPA